jgi:tRNA nucleotidyltransferase/poly(A) polymerase
LIQVDDLLLRIKRNLPDDINLYLVGGAVRDILLSRKSHDLDFVVDGDVFTLARRIADHFHGAYFPLDEEHGTARVILTNKIEEKQILDFNQLRGQNIEEDLRSRDFSINAMAFLIGDSFKLLDPLGGEKDLISKRLRICAEDSIVHDPLRLVRGVRLSVEFNLQITSETISAMKKESNRLTEISSERKRDEIFRILEGKKSATAIRILDHLNALFFILPNLPSMKGIEQSPPHVFDVWDHTLYGLDKIGSLISILGNDLESEKDENFEVGITSIYLGKFREFFKKHFSSPMNPDRSHSGLLKFAFLYHDAGKPSSRSVDEAGRVRFFNHDCLGSELVVEMSERLHLSNYEISRLQAIVSGHMRPLLLMHQQTSPTPKAIYRFYHQFDTAGVDICILALADTLATYGPTLPQEIWEKTLLLIRTLLEAWWEKPELQVKPPTLLNGDDLILLFKLKQGPEIGRILEEIREAQVEGKIFSRQDAIRFVKEIVDPIDDSSLSF